MVPLHKNLVKIVYENYDTGEEVVTGALLDKINDELAETYVRELAFDKYSISKMWEDIYPRSNEEIQLYKYAKDIIRNFKISRIDREISDNHKKLEEAEQEEDRIELMKINRGLQKNKESIIEELNVDV
jgi:hypothetical protein